MKLITQIEWNEWSYNSNNNIPSKYARLSSFKIYRWITSVEPLVFYVKKLQREFRLVFMVVLFITQLLLLHIWYILCKRSLIADCRVTVNYAHTTCDPRDISLDSLIKRQRLYGNNRVINVWACTQLYQRRYIDNYCMFVVYSFEVFMAIKNRNVEMCCGTV